MKKIDDFLVFNFLVRDRANLEEILEVTDYIVPGIIAADFADIDTAVDKITELKALTDVISIGLGDDGNPKLWERVLKIAEKANPGHVNQPFEKSSYVRGYLDGKGIPQIVNALVNPSGKPGLIRLTSGREMKVDDFLDLVRVLGIESVKMVPVAGHLEELKYLIFAAANKGIRCIEPAGGIDENNIKEIVDAARDSGIEFFMPHIFGAVLEKETGRTNPAKVRNIIKAVGG